MHVPGWHEATKELQRQGKLQLVGILQEQHPDRARLFMQWKQMGWPLLVDSLNLLEVPYVPITLAVDEHGVIRTIHPPLARPENLEEDFLAQTYEKSPTAATPATPRPDLEALAAATSRETATAWRAYANALVLWGGARRLDEAIAAYQRALGLEPGHGYTHFRLGVAYRMRYDSEARQPTDFQNAVQHWSRALALDPNNYIWRRRIQQYGPRLDKPYSFYDWVHQAREEIRARGETPRPLRVEPGGAEFASPAKKFTAGTTSAEEPDPEGRIWRDAGRFVRIETAVVPAAIAPGEAARLHLVFRPNLTLKAHWNNEVDDLVFWVNPPPGWDVDDRRLTVPNPPANVSQEVRQVEFEVRSPPGVEAESVLLPGYALYYVCEDVNGICLYRRQDVALRVPLHKKSP